MSALSTEWFEPYRLRSSGRHEVVDVMECGEILIGPGDRDYTCHAEWGTEHSHSDLGPLMRRWRGDIHRCAVEWCDTLWTPEGAARHMATNPDHRMRR